MEVKFPEPCSPLIFYKKSVENKKFSPYSLEKLLSGFEKDLDKVYLKLDNRVTILDYSLIFYRADNSEIIEYMAGGFDLSVKGGGNIQCLIFKKDIKKFLKLYWKK